jgi:hypothetical protein
MYAVLPVCKTRCIPSSVRLCACIRAVILTETSDFLFIINKNIGASMYVLYGYLYITLKVSAYKHLKSVLRCNCTPSKHYIARLPNKMFVRLKYISHVSPFSPAKITCNQPRFCLGKQSHEQDILAYSFSPPTQYTCLVQIVCASKQANLNKN